ncbi:MAG: hypothetical protein IPM50_01230 [Acidobacteriota bacterium]|nr:MAG: hypothetical protein IPM50_01230 [Acidobacteriota bacterium]
MTIMVQNYAYDSLNRLKSAEETIASATSWKQTYTFDRYGNRRFDFTGGNTTFPDPNCPEAICNPMISTSNNRLTSTGWQYDNAGNTINDPEGRTFIYDGENKQKEVRDQYNTVIGQYFFDGDGKRVKKVVPGTGEVTVFVYDTSGRSIAEYSTVVESVENAKVAYLTNDHLGSPRINTDRDGNVTARHDYHPFGEQIYTAQRTTALSYDADTVRKQFTGYEKDDESNLNFAKARYQNSNLGRFTSPDPLMASARRVNPQTFNRYSYVVNNPLNFVDPLGLQDCPAGTTCTSPCKRGEAGCFTDLSAEIAVVEVRDETPSQIIETSTAVLGTTVALRPILSILSESIPRISAGAIMGSIAAPLVVPGIILGTPTTANPTDCPSNVCPAGTGQPIPLTGAPAVPDARTDTMPPPPNLSGPLVVFHGTDVNSATNIITGGLNVQNAINLGGGDVFWTTTNLGTARIFAEANPSGGTPAVIQLTLPRQAADAMIGAGTLRVGEGGTYMFQRPSWPQVNSTGVFTRVQ